MFGDACVVVGFFCMCEVGVVGVVLLLLVAVVVVVGVVWVGGVVRVTAAIATGNGRGRFVAARVVTWDGEKTSPAEAERIVEQTAAVVAAAQKDMDVDFSAAHNQSNDTT